MKIKFTLILLIFITQLLHSQNDTIQGEAEYRKIYDCRYEPGNVLVVQKKGKTLEYMKSWSLSKEGFVIRMEAIYDLEFADGKRFKSGVIKNISTDSITISSTMNEKCAQYEGIKYKFFTYPIKDIKIARFINDRSLGFFTKRKMEDFDLIVQKVDKAKFCPYLLTFTKRNNEVKVCHYYLTSQGYDLLFETNGYLDYMEYQITSKP
ncbi:hypothetical protein [Flavobacterium phycosphaerae]|uniref:hypothetical protein n=1 Tax=Flavobacterium phycosphaerae TaxID=2697515 RepID=UPI001F1618DF|nr:hypothetical protein [Flavobacterium phycosphaerae]